MVTHLGSSVVLLGDGLISLLPRCVPAVESHSLRRAGTAGAGEGEEQELGDPVCMQLNWGAVG